MSHAVPEFCPKCGDTFRSKKTRYGRLRTCQNNACTVQQWLNADGTARGTPADLATRDARMAAHAAFDQLWKSGSMKRGRAYALLAFELGRKVAHMAEMDIEECRAVIAFATRELKARSAPSEPTTG